MRHAKLQIASSMHHCENVMPEVHVVEYLACKQHTRNAHIRARCHVGPIDLVLRQNRLHWFGHMVLMDG